MIRGLLLLFGLGLVVLGSEMQERLSVKYHKVYWTFYILGLVMIFLGIALS